LTSIEAFRRKDGMLQPLEEGPNGLLCAEGEAVVFRTCTAALPQLSLCGEGLAPIPGSLRIDGTDYIAEFERLIDMWAGRTVFTLADGTALIALLLDIGPHEKKLGLGAWEELIQELSAISGTLPWGMSPGAASGVFEPDALATVHPAIIERELPILERLLRQLLADPPSKTLRIRAIRPLELSRGADLRTLRWLSRRPLELAGLRGQALEGQPPDARALADQPATVTSFDHPITSYIAFLLGKVRARLDETARRLSLPAGHGVPDPAANAYARQLSAQVAVAAHAIAIVLRAPLFRAVRPEPHSDAVLQSLPDHPLYSAIHRVGRRLLEPGLAYAPGQDLLSALKHSYDLFELLVLYRIVGALQANLGSDWKLTRHARISRLPHEDRPKDGAIWVWRGPEGQFLELRYQARFRPAKPPPDPHVYSSLSAQGVPDYIIVHHRPGLPRRWIILDAKYRCSRKPIHDALGDIHRYRDALRVDGRQADAAYIVVPSLQVDAALYGDAAFVRVHGLGALVVYEPGWLDPVWRWLASAVEVTA
jgi:hypothetical protein